MSLRDQLLSAGLVDKSAVRKANRDLKKKRKKRQGKREKKSVVAARQRAEAEAAQQARAEKVRAERAQELARREAHSRKRALRSLLRSHRLPSREGNQLFFHRAAHGPGVVRNMWPESWVDGLCKGTLAVVWAGPTRKDPDYVVVPESVARRLQASAPQRIVHFNAEPIPPTCADEQPYDMAAMLEARERVPDRWQGLR